jgi:hypothetical protein
MYSSFCRYCQRQVSADALGEKFVPSARAIFCRVSFMETMMRTLKTEEMELVAGGDAGGIPHDTSKQQNNGLGNGDQTAPGNSLNRNQAENNVGETSGNPPGSGNFPVVPN